MAPKDTDRRTFLKGVGLSAAGAAFGIPALTACNATKAGTTAQTSGAPSATSGKPVRGGSANLAIQDTPVNMDPAQAQLYASMQVYQNIFSELLEVDADYNFHGNLATHWSQEDDTTWLFEIVDNAVFQNGEPVTANDVSYTIQRTKTQALGAYLEFFDKVEVLNPHKFRIHLAKPFGPMEATLAYLVDITNEKAIKAHSPTTSPVGCGPYQLKEWVHNSHITLERWDKYFKSDVPYLDEVTFTSVGDDTVRLTGLQTGQYDWIQAVPAQQLNSLMSSSSMDHTPALPALPYILFMNTSKPPFHDQRVRQAVGWAIDRSEIVKLAFFGTAVEATEPITKQNPFYSGVNPYEGGPDLDKANAMMRQAGVSNVDVEFLSQQEVPVYTSIGQILQSQLAKIGINLHITKLSAAEWFSQFSKLNYGLGVTYESTSLDPAQSYYLDAYSKSPFNWTGFKNAAVDAALQKFTFQSDQKARKQYYPTLVNAVAEQAPYLFLANQNQQYWTTPNLHGAEPLPSLEIRVEDMWTSK
jgi:peptide/nickel transport system substrate-binding protein